MECMPANTHARQVNIQVQSLLMCENLHSPWTSAMTERSFALIVELPGDMAKA
jgi:hypothetical protein